MPLEVGKRYRVKGQLVDIVDSNAAGKKKAAITSDGNRINFGQAGEVVQPGTESGNNYCARSSGIKSGRGLSANDLARADWHCNGKTSRKKGPSPVGDS
jgi:hypothetical protein